jgi:toxin CcdB
MPQFTAHRNPNPATRGEYPLLLDVQSELLSDLGTRVVVPLCPATAMKGRLVKSLMPVLHVEGKAYAMLTPQLAGVSRQHLGPAVADLSAAQADVLAALDLLIVGF